jgi:hypothetical protein
MQLIRLQRETSMQPVIHLGFRRYADFRASVPSDAIDSGGFAFAWCKPPAAGP